MPIDTSMYQNMRLPDFVGAYMQGKDWKQGQDKFKKEQAIEEAKKSAYVVGPDGKFSMSPEGMKKLAGVAPEVGYQTQRQFAQDKDADAKTSYESELREADILSRSFAGANAENYGQIRQKLISDGLAAENELPPQYDQKYISSLHAKTMSHKDMLEQQNKERALAIEAQKSGGKGAAAPAGYRFRADGSLEPIPGGPADAKVGAAAEKEQKQKDMAVTNANIVNQDIGRAMEIIDKNSLATGGEAGVIGMVPGTAAHNLDKMLDSVKANAAFDKLQAMREASPTGGALGAVSDREMGLLQAAVGSLDKTLPKDVLKDNLKRVANLQLDIIHGPGRGPKRHQLSFDESGKSIAQNPGGGGMGMDAANASTPPELRPKSGSEIKWKAP